MAENFTCERRNGKFFNANETIRVADTLKNDTLPKLTGLAP